jgi:hypothetical protein
MPNSQDSGTISIRRGDVMHRGSYTVSRGMITVRGPHGSRTTHLSSGSGTVQLSLNSVESFAKVLLAKVMDQDKMIRRLLDRGLSRIESSTSIDQLFASLAATLGELAFLQIGFVPRGHSRLDRIPLITKNWRLDPVRSIQYVQSSAQRATQARIRKRSAQNGET